MSTDTDDSLLGFSPPFAAFAYDQTPFDPSSLPTDFQHKWNNLENVISNIMESMLQGVGTKINPGTALAIHRTVHKLSCDKSNEYIVGREPSMLKYAYDRIICIVEKAIENGAPHFVSLSALLELWNGFFQLQRTITKVVRHLEKRCIFLLHAKPFEAGFQAIFREKIFVPHRKTILHMIESLLDHLRSSRSDKLEELRLFLRMLSWIHSDALVEVQAFKREAIVSSCRSFYQDWVPNPRHALIDELQACKQQEIILCTNLSALPQLGDVMKVLYDEAVEPRKDILKETARKRVLAAGSSDETASLLEVAAIVLFCRNRITMLQEIVQSIQDAVEAVSLELIPSATADLAGQMNDKERSLKRRRAIVQKPGNREAANLHSLYRIVVFLTHKLREARSSFPDKNDSRLDFPQEELIGNEQSSSVINGMIRVLWRTFDEALQRIHHHVYFVASVFSRREFSIWSEAELQDLLTRVQEKDILEEALLCFLGRRILANGIGSRADDDDSLRSVAGILSSRYRHRASTMMNDALTSADISDAVIPREKIVEKDSIATEPHSLTILSGALWPVVFLHSFVPRVEILGSSCREALPLLKGFDQVARRYEVLFPNRQLSFLPRLSTVEFLVRRVGTKTSWFIRVPFHLGALLLMATAEDADCLCKVRISKELHLSPRDTERLIDLATRALDKTEAKSYLFVRSKDGNDDVLVLNRAFKANKRKISLPVLCFHPLGVSASIESVTSRTLDSVQKNRALLIEAHIVRLMKYHKTAVPVQTIVGEVISSFSERFPVSSQDVKGAIEGLIGRDYLQRNKGDRTRVDYVA